MSPRPPHLLDVEARLLGVLIEKAYTTPDQYPLSLNAATNGCNQKSNRDPVLDLSQAEVSVAMEGLVQKHLAGRVFAAGSRVEKFRHTAGEGLGLDREALSVLAELLLRGPQSAGELRARVARMGELPEGAPAAALQRLEARGVLARLAPSPGHRAERFRHTLCDAREARAATPLDVPVPRAPRTDAAPGAPAATGTARPELPVAATPPPAAGPSAGASLEQRVAALERAVAALSARLDRS